MRLNTKQQQDLEAKLLKVKDIIGFPINKKELEKLEQIHYILDELIYLQDKITLPIKSIDLGVTNTNRAVELFEEYL